ncbi:TPA: hypothetical protein ACSKLZ_001183 [Listeria innocua]|uniref:hypothetical protein n=1 Tax=Listeria innocua TaxID=1642 RepID=UPI001F19C183|nr:hypothetical protein [Listeria innocua]
MILNTSTSQNGFKKQPKKSKKVIKKTVKKVKRAVKKTTKKVQKTVTKFKKAAKKSIKQARKTVKKVYKKAGTKAVNKATSKIKTVGKKANAKIAASKEAAAKAKKEKADRKAAAKEALCKNQEFLESQKKGYSDPTYDYKAGYPRPDEAWAFDANGNIDKEKSAEVSEKIGEWSTYALMLVIPGPEELLIAGFLVKVGGKVGPKTISWGATKFGAKGSGNAGKILENANYAQKTFGNKFSAEGSKIYSKLAGEPINTIDDLVKVIESGKVKVSDLPVEYIVRDGNTLILNTRTSQALTQAGIPRAQWNAVNRTGNQLFEELLTGQLNRNKLPDSGIESVRPSGGN